MRKLVKMQEDKNFKVAKQICKNKLNLFNNMDFAKQSERLEMIRSILGYVGDNTEIMPPFWCDMGQNISVGHDTYINHGTVILDCANVDIGNHVRIAPGVVIAAVAHPLEPQDRLDKTYDLISAVTICDNVWIGANAVINLGVTIGANSIVGAGCVVLDDVPANVIVGGVPAKVIKKL